MQLTNKWISCSFTVLEKCLACDRYFADSDLITCYDRHCKEGKLFSR